MGCCSATTLALKGVECLGSDVLATAMLFCDIETIFGRITLVCRKWRRAALLRTVLLQKVAELNGHADTQVVKMLTGSENNEPAHLLLTLCKEYSLEWTSWIVDPMGAYYAHPNLRRTQLLMAVRRAPAAALEKKDVFKCVIQQGKDASLLILLKKRASSCRLQAFSLIARDELHMQEKQIAEVFSLTDEVPLSRQVRCKHWFGSEMWPSLSPITEEPMCSCCDEKENLWMCLECGHIGCTRSYPTEFGDRKLRMLSGIQWKGNGHAHDHHCQTNHPFSVKLNAATRGEFHCYSCNDEFVDEALIKRRLTERQLCPTSPPLRLSRQELEPYHRIVDHCAWIDSIFIQEGNIPTRLPTEVISGARRLSSHIQQATKISDWNSKTLDVLGINDPSAFSCSFFVFEMETYFGLLTEALFRP